VVRLGRILDAKKSIVTTDCALVGGDSGGPLFDMTGKVIAIHSRIGNSIAANMHVPVDTYRDGWEDLGAGKVIGGRGGPYLGVEMDTDSGECRVAKVVPDTAAAKAGFQVDDVITKFNGRQIETSDDLRAQMARRRAGDDVTIEVRRGGETLSLK